MLQSAPFPMPKNITPMLGLAAFGVAIPLLAPILGIFLFLFIAGLVVFVVGVAFVAFVLWLIVRRFWPGSEREAVTNAAAKAAQDKPDRGK
jgi:predicted lipid-binding transport protein (Tim44 family)